MQVTVGTMVATFDHRFYIVEGYKGELYIASRLTKTFERDKRYTPGSALLSKGSIRKLIIPIDLTKAVG